MHLIFWFAEKGYEKALGPALISGAASHGDTVEMRPLGDYRAPAADGGLICGVVKREVLWDHQAANHPLLYMDKGYHRARAPWGNKSLLAWWRLCWGAVHPTRYFMSTTRPADRWLRLGVELKDARQGENIIILGSSAKFHQTERLDPPTAWTQRLVDNIAERTSRPIIYRPKPSWADAQAVRGAAFDHGGKTPIADVLARAHCSITHGSIACVDSVIAGVPCIVLGSGVAEPISSTFLRDVAQPYWAPISAREQWAANLSYCHFTPTEIAAGIAWGIVKEQMRYAV